MSKFTSTLLQVFFFVVLLYAFMLFLEHGAEGFEQAVLNEWTTIVQTFRG